MIASYFPALPDASQEALPTSPRLKAGSGEVVVNRSKTLPGDRSTVRVHLTRRIHRSFETRNFLERGAPRADGPPVPPGYRAASPAPGVTPHSVRRAQSEAA